MITLKFHSLAHLADVALNTGKMRKMVTAALQAQHVQPGYDMVVSWNCWGTGNENVAVKAQDTRADIPATPIQFAGAPQQAATAPAITRTLGGDRWDGLKAQAESATLPHASTGMRRAPADQAYIDALKQSCENRGEEIRVMRGQLAEASGTEKRLRADIAALRADLDQQAANYAQANLTIADQQETIQGLREHLANLQGKCDLLSNSLEHAAWKEKAEVDRLNENIETLKREIGLRTDQLQSLQFDNKAQAGLIDQHNDSEKLAAIIRTLRDERDQARGELGRYADQVQELQTLSRSYQWRILSMQREAGVANAAGLPAIDPIDIDPTAGSPPA